MNLITAAGQDGGISFLCDLVRERSAIEIDSTKNYLVESRLTPIAKAHGFDSLRSLAGALRNPGSHRLIEAVVEAMTTNETSFFRDRHPFDAMKKVVLPELIEKRKNTRELTIWSNACSTGQEIVSISLTLREYFPELKSWKIRLIASDISNQVLEKARTGIFNQTEINRGMPLPMVIKYFEKEGLHWRLKPEVLEKVEFKKINLIENWPSSIPKMDIVFLRNVLIYFSTNTKKTILEKVHKVLRPDGYLFLGGAETMMGMDSPYERSMIGKASVFRPTSTTQPQK